MYEQLLTQTATEVYLYSIDGWWILFQTHKSLFEAKYGCTFIAVKKVTVGCAQAQLIHSTGRVQVRCDWLNLASLRSVWMMSANVFVLEVYVCIRGWRWLRCNPLYRDKKLSIEEFIGGNLITYLPTRISKILVYHSL